MIDQLKVHTNSFSDAQGAMNTLLYFLSSHQHIELTRLIHKSEEKQFFRDKVVELASIIHNMPLPYKSDPENPIVQLHYFYGGSDWYVIERDNDKAEPQLQCFNMTSDGSGGKEYGYVSLVELFAAAPVELDLHWKAKPAKEIKL